MGRPNSCGSAGRGPSRRALVLAGCPVRIQRASRPWPGPPAWSDQAPPSARRTRPQDVPVPEAWPTGRLRSGQTSTRSISRRRAASSSFSRASRRAAPEFTSRTCRAIVQPRRDSIRPHRPVLHCQSLLIIVVTRAYSPTRNIFGRFRAWPKTLSVAFGEARLAAISECHLTMAACFPARQDSS
jgi:hypothetical protein